MFRAVFRCLVVLTVAGLFRGSSGHGRLLEPPARNSLWRFPDEFPSAEPNYDDNAMNCGGMSYQHFSVGGKCGICGDKWIPNSPFPRAHEAGGRYARGIIARRYGRRDVINVTIQVTATHRGYFEFRLCPVNDVTRPASHRCLDRHLLRLEDGQTRYYYGDKCGLYHIRVRLPDDVTCTQCVFQWKWTTGNSWGVDPSGVGCLGCGPQEEFYGCADISIEDGRSPGADEEPQLNDPGHGMPSPERPDHAPATEEPSYENSVEKTSSCRANGVYSDDPVNDEWCAIHCPLGECPETRCICSDEHPAGKPASPCHATGAYAGDPTMDEWCATNCPLGNCPPSHCLCFEGDVAEESGLPSCHAAGAYAGDPSMDEWCATNCPLGNCPPSHCLCSEGDVTEESGLPSCHAVGAYAGDPTMDEWCATNCPLGNCPPSHCLCSEDDVAEESGLPSCHAAGAYAGDPTMDEWCATNCPLGNCPPSHCLCSEGDVAEESGLPSCHAAGAYAGDPSMDEWCATNCRRGFCPRTHCACAGDPAPTLRCKGAGVWAAIESMAKWCEINCMRGNCPPSHCDCS